MELLSGIVEWATRWFSRGAMVTVAAMALLIAYAVTVRTVAAPLAGEHEMVEMMMLTIVMLGLAFAQRERGHIAVELLVDHFTPRWQAAADLLSVVLTVAGCGVIGWANLMVAYEYATATPISTDFLSVPLYPFKIAVGLGFWLWGLQAFRTLPPTWVSIRGGWLSGGQEERS